MLSYLINRWILTSRFEKADSGYIYRRRSDLPGFVVSEQEREDLLRKIFHRYWKSWLFLIAFLLSSVTLVVIVAGAFDLDDGFLRFATYGIIAAFAGCVLWEQRAVLLLPEKHFANCPQIEPEIPRAGWLDRFHTRMRNQSWKEHSAMFLFRGAIVWLFSHNLSEADLWQWFVLIVGITSVIVSLYGAVHKARSTADP